LLNLQKNSAKICLLIILALFFCRKIGVIDKKNDMEEAMSSVQLLDKTRKIGKLLHNNNSSKVVFNDICDVMTDILASNVLVISKKGKVLGTGLRPEVIEITELLADHVPADWPVLHHQHGAEPQELARRVRPGHGIDQGRSGFQDRNRLLPDLPERPGQRRILLPDGERGHVLHRAGNPRIRAAEVLQRQGKGLRVRGRNHD